MAASANKKKNNVKKEKNEKKAKDEKRAMAVFKIDISKRALQPFGKIKKNKNANKEKSEKNAKDETGITTIMLRYFEVDGRTGRRFLGFDNLLFDCESSL